jgi:hypothetical protein
VVQRIPPHTTQTPHHHLIYMGIQGRGGGVERRRQVEEVEFLSKRQVDRVGFPTREDKWKRCNSSQYGAAVCKLLCAKKRRSE